jgi:hypothetical protein
MCLRTCRSFIVSPQKSLLQIAKFTIYKLASSQKRLGSQIQNSQSAIIAECPQTNKLFQSANLQICDLWNLFTDRPPLKIRKKNSTLYKFFHTFATSYFAHSIDGVI